MSNVITIDQDSFCKLVGILTRAYPEEDCIQPDTFAVIKDPEDGNKENLGITWADYQNGYAFSRKYEGLKLDITEFCKSFPIVLCERGDTTLSGDDFENECSDITILIANKITCTDCPDKCQKSEGEVERDMLKLTKSLLKGLAYSKAFNCVKGVDTFVLWGDTGLMDYYVAQGTIDSYTNSNAELRDVVDFDTPQLTPFRGTSDVLCGFTVTFRICTCIEGLDETVFDYSFKPHDPVGITKCIYCP